jgi:hypothetical protein
MEGLDLERRQCVAADEVARKEKLERGMKRRTVAIATKSTQVSPLRQSPPYFLFMSG